MRTLRRTIRSLTCFAFVIGLLPALGNATLRPRFDHERHKLDQENQQSATNSFPLSARITSESSPLIVGLYARNLRVVIRNTTPDAARQGVAMPLQAIVLRGVHWANYRDDERKWLSQLYGSTTEKPDGSVDYNNMAQQLTRLSFEAGLILPSEERVVEVPITPQENSRHDLVVDYAVIGNGRDWMGEVLLPDQSKGRTGTVYRPATAERTRQRKGVAEENAIVRSTSKPDAPPLPVQTKVFSLQLPVSSVAQPQMPLPGMIPAQRLSATDAAQLAGLDPMKDRYLAFYREALQSWFFVRTDRSAVALRLEFPQKAPQAIWRKKLLPNMDLTAPDDFCAHTANTTEILLRPETFSDIVKVNTPKVKMYYEPGATEVTMQQLWSILDRARERVIPVRIVTFDPNGLGVTHLLSAGVKVDSAGRWTEPTL